MVFVYNRRREQNKCEGINKLLADITREIEDMVSKLSRIGEHL